jgi:hypothetical protein
MQILEILQNMIYTKNMDTTKSKMKKKILANSDFDKIWSIDDFKNFPRSNVLKAYSDFVKEGVLKRAKRGFYYRSKKTVLGETSYTNMQLALSKAKGKCGFYCISGTAGYNELGLTTQVPNNIVIACDYNLRAEDNIKFVYRKKPINGGKAERIILDAIIDIKTIPDTTVEKIINQIKILIKNKKVSLKSLVKSAFYETTRVKSIIGAIAQEFDFDNNLLNKLKKSLNPLSMVHLNVGNSLLYAKNWQIRAEKNEVFT